MLQLLLYHRRLLNLVISTGALICLWIHSLAQLSFHIPLYSIHRWDLTQSSSVYNIDTSGQKAASGGQHINNTSSHLRPSPDAAGRNGR
jgi:hypothetical protein